MIVNKTGAAVANLSEPIHIFESATEFEAWKTATGVSDEDLKKMFIVHKYHYAPGCYVEVNNITELDNLAPDNKVQGVLYGTREEGLLYRYDEFSGQFIPYNQGV